MEISALFAQDHKKGFLHLSVLENDKNHFATSITDSRQTLLARIDHSAVQSSTRTFFHNAFLFIDISNNE